MSLNDGHETCIDPYTLIFQIPNLPDTGCFSATSGARSEVMQGAGLSANHIVLGPTKRLTIGRAEDQDVILPDAQRRDRTACWSRQDGWYALNAGSANGLPSTRSGSNNKP